MGLVAELVQQRLNVMSPIIVKTANQRNHPLTRNAFFRFSRAHFP